MTAQQLAIVTISWARTAEEEALLTESLQQLSTLGLPVYVADGGSPETFIEFLHTLPNFHVLQPLAKGLWNQVHSAIVAAQRSNTPFFLYTEPDKLDFFKTNVSDFLSGSQLTDEVGVVLAARSQAGMQSFPAFQQQCEHTINFCCAEVTGLPYDYTYGPFIFNSKLIPHIEELAGDIDWGWRPYLFCKAHLLGMHVKQYEGDYYCPESQREDNHAERIYRMKQLYQNIEGVVQAAKGSSQSSQWSSSQWSRVLEVFSFAQSLKGLNVGSRGFNPRK